MGNLRTFHDQPISVGEMNENHPFWGIADTLINDLAPGTRRDEWWRTDGPRVLIFRALMFAKHMDDPEPKDDA